MNIREVAELAGVSIATVSRYLNSGSISEKSASKVKQAIEQLGYTPNALAKSVLNNDYRMIGVMVPSLANPFFYELTASIEKFCSKQGYSIFISNTDDDREKEARSIELFKRHRVAGILANRARCRDEYKGIGIPVVAFEDAILPEIPIVSSDNYQGGRKAFEYLYENKCRRLLHVTGPSDFVAIKERQEGFLDAADEYGVSCEVVRLESDFKFDPHRSLNDTNSILWTINWSEFDGIFVFNDIAAAITMKVIAQHGIKIPEDILVVSFDNSFLCALLSPTLSSFTQPAEEIGRLMVSKLMDLIQGKPIDPMDHRIMPNLVLRESSNTKEE